MTGQILTYEGKVFLMPTPLAWKFEYACGVPCDSFWIEVPWQKGEEEIYRKAVRFTAQEAGEVVFTGVIDETEWTRDRRGSRVTLSGRSLAALLLDNESEAADYETATLADILAHHVTPYGIESLRDGEVPPCQNFRVASGSSQWQVVYDFVRYHGKIQPRFDREGRLVLTPFGDETVKVLDDTVPVTSFVGREKRYGVLSEILVRDKKRQTEERVVNEEFAAQGGQTRRILTMTGSPGQRAMRYSGQYQLDKSETGRRRLELTVPALFFVWPGELIQLSRADCGDNGIWRVLETIVTQDADGGRTQLLLGLPDITV